MARPIVSDVGVLDKIMAILGVLGSTPHSLASVAQATGHHRATAHRLLHAMEKHRLVRMVDGGWILGSRLVDLGHQAAVGLPLRDAAHPALERLREQTGESVQLYVRDGDKRVCVESLESPHGLRTIVALGAILPLEAGSAGRVLRADPSAFSKGWAESVGEREAGVASVSAPIYDSSGVVRAAVSVSGPIERTTRAPGKKYARAVVEAARSIERSAGWAPDDTSRGT